MNTDLTLAGSAVSIGITYLNLRPWWKGGRSPKDLLPFSGSFLLGSTATMCTGGILGWLAGCSATSANKAGGTVVRGTTGTEGGAIAHGSLGALTPDGGVVVFLTTIAVGAAWRAAGKADRRRMAGGAFCGTSLTFTAGVAGALSWLPGAVNGLGATLRSGLEGALSL
ncbi:hypothetical protein I5Q34_32590 [Streptomyces sp. AV19]|uniref:hypothetical protein n=1 Tax=Streptomyces sp. AV19 TaxID=2793068 RepID=UPI0018FE9E70|nr:hypothetical protein [Streptomyces sp. AV19]MBH1938945.1 hypothetical protein [Streptomyces sp. AV19]MDG4531630.1 hypothetical protein [Streptomyces sp. AV19]MDG4535309.1 hypothetical protein [Streptomyces sp. AV19]